MQQSCPVFFDIGDQAEICAQLFYVKELPRVVKAAKEQ